MKNLRRTLTCCFRAQVGSSDSVGLGAELLAMAQDGVGQGDKILQILKRDPTLINVTDPVGDTLLHVMARSGNLEVVEQVVRWVIQHEQTEVLMEQNLQGDTPLHLAAANRHRRVAQLLYSAESRVESVANEGGVNPLALAGEAGFVLRRIIQLAGTADIELDLVRSDLDETCHRNHQKQEDDVWLIIKFYRAIINGREDSVLEALREHPYLASRMLGSMGTIPHLREHTCPASGMLGFMGNFLHVAAKLGQVGVLRLLVGQMTHDEAASLMLVGNYRGSTPLHVALEGNHRDAASYLIELAPRAAYQVDKKGVSPLYLAFARGYEDLVKYVFQMIPIAKISRSTIQSLLTAKKASLGNAAIKARNLGLLEYLLEELPEIINVLDYKGWRVLSYAAYKGYLDGVRFLLTNFPNSVKEYDRDGSLPIHKAVGGGHVSIVKEFLLLCPETMYQTDKKGQNILHFAVKYTKTDVLEYLTKETTEVRKIFSLKDNEGKTFFDLASELKC